MFFLPATAASILVQAVIPMSNGMMWFRQPKPIEKEERPPPVPTLTAIPRLLLVPVAFKEKGTLLILVAEFPADATVVPSRSVSPLILESSKVENVSSNRRPRLFLTL